MNVVELLQGQMNPQMISQLTQHIGADSDDQTEAAVSGIISTLVAGLSKNTRQPGGTAALVSAIDRDHDGSVLDDVAGFLLGQRQTSNPKTLNGAGILGHVLGNNQSMVTDMLGRVTGLNNSQIGKLMLALAPIVLAALGKARHQEGLDTGGIGDLLNRSVRSQANQRQEMGLLQRFLDTDGDGSVMDDIANLGMKYFLSRR
jgi:hypothetical protein